MRPTLPIRFGLPAAVPLLVLALAACGGSNSSGAKVASAQTGSPSASGSSSTKAGADSSIQAELAQYVAGQRKWAACLQKHGLNVGDPDAKGNVDFGNAGDVKRDPHKLNALKSCEKVEASESLQLLEYLQPKKSDKEIADSKAYAKCMQENGAPDFPDFDDQGYQPLNSTWNQNSSEAIHGMTLCSQKIYHQRFDPNANG
jgi:hypothetical protein